ncbi:uncharacterized protein LOC123309609 [Coccinella septempunctata]|uniref:uncharacterized protein LOC123309609 n=1 Tax=Coccinella septempunctata TaxID=41139 RepID=UPI001D077093|nr:uncharacterized protein LOC123309609 [Coccinella septempunctata]
MGYSRVFPAVLFILLVLNVADSEGKRGCANFGHSCYGGMGKRAPKELMQFTDPRQNQGEILIGSRFFNDKPYVKLKMNRLQYQQLSRILRQWIHSQTMPQNFEDDKNQI